MSAYTYELEATVTAPGDFYERYDVAWVTSNGVATTHRSHIFGKTFTITNRIMTIFNPDSPLNTPDSSPGCSPNSSPTPAQTRKHDKKWRKALNVIYLPKEKLQHYCLAQIDDCQILYNCDAKGALADDIGYENFQISERNSSARDKLYEIKFQFDSPIDLDNPPFLRFQVKYLVGKGEDFRGYAVTSNDDMGARLTWTLEDAIRARAFGDLEVNFEEWKIDKKEGESEVDYLSKARKYLRLLDNPSLVDVEDNHVEAEKKPTEEKQDGEKALEGTNDPE